MNSKIYRADKVVTLMDAGVKLANGDKDLEAELLDTLKRWPHIWNGDITLRVRRGNLASDVLLGAVVSFLEGEGFLLGDEWPRLHEVNQAHATTYTYNDASPGPSEHIEYLAKLIEQWDTEEQGKLTAKTLEAHIRKLLDKGVKGIPFTKHGISGLSLKGEDEPIKAFQNMYSKANKLLGRNARFSR